MELKVFATIFVTVFLAELGDKTQLATMLFAADEAVSKWLVFAAASAALVVSAGLGVVVGGALASYIDEKVLAYLAGFGFILIGAYTVYQAGAQA
jgi:putative Ca2+/H+ antiporter (TMEM165/GDT1 family)